MRNLALNFKNAPLPIPPMDYSPEHFRQLIRVLEIYFNQLNAWNLQVYNALTSSGGASIILPYGAFYQNGTTALTGNLSNNSTTPIPVTSTSAFQNSGFLIIGTEIIEYTGKTSNTFTGITRGVKGSTNVSHNTGDAVSEAAAVTVGTAAASIIDTVVSSYLVTCTVPDSRVYFSYAGIYNIQFSAQFLNFTTSDDNVTVWFRKNGTDVPESASIQQVNAKHGSSPGASILALNLIEVFAEGDYVELYWTSNSGNTVLGTYPAGTTPTTPVSPSLILTATFVSAIPTS
jgi:hypothetical protein